MVFTAFLIFHKNREMKVSTHKYSPISSWLIYCIRLYPDFIVYSIHYDGISKKIGQKKSSPDNTLIYDTIWINTFVKGDKRMKKYVFSYLQCTEFEFFNSGWDAEVLVQIDQKTLFSESKKEEHDHASHYSAS